MSKRPNIFVYMIDTARRRNMSCYGYHRPTAPNIGRIADEGAIFDNHFTVACWSLPSQVSFMTGKHVCGHGCGDQYQFLEPGIPTMAEVLNRHGYHTAAIQPNPWVQQDEGNCMRGFTEFMHPMKSGPGGNALPLRPPYTPVEGESDTGMCWKMAGWVEDWLDRNADRDEPWMLFVLTGETHMACWPPRKYREQFLPPGYPDEKAKEVLQRQFQGTAGIDTHTAEEWEIIRCLRDGAMAYVDNAIGAIYDNMRERGLLDDTIFVVTSDHGDSHGEHGFHTAHCQTALWDTMLHTPLVMRYPNGVKTARVEHLAANVDVMPTLLELCGIDDAEANEHMHGHSLLPAIEGEPVREFVMAELQKALEPMHWIPREDPGFDYRVFNRHMKAARTREWKYIWSSDAAKDGLYHVASDPDEQKNLLGEKPDVAEGLRVKMEDLLLKLDHRDFGDALKHTGHVKIDPEVEKRLAAWGIYRRIIGAPVKQ